MKRVIEKNNNNKDTRATDYPNYHIRYNSLPVFFMSRFCIYYALCSVYYYYIRFYINIYIYQKFRHLVAKVSTLESVYKYNAQQYFAVIHINIYVDIYIGGSLYKIYKYRTSDISQYFKRG